jgi:hypothetical protein
LFALGEKALDADVRRLRKAMKAVRAEMLRKAVAP